MSENFLEVRVVAGCIIERNGKILMVREAQERRQILDGKEYFVKGLWNIPAGRVDKGETFEEAAVREAREETGYDVEIFGRPWVAHTHPDTPVFHIYTAKIIGDSGVRNENEIDQLQWMSFDEIAELHGKSLLRADAIWQIIVDYFAGQSRVN